MTTRKKIAIVTPHHWTGSYGGAEYQISLLIGELSKSHPQLDLHYLCKPSDNHISPIDHTIHEISTQRWFSKYGTFFDSWSLYQTLKSLKPDYIYQRVGCAYTGICAYYARKHNINMLWHIALDLDVRPCKSTLLFKKPHHWLEKRILEFGLRNSPMIVAQKKSQADDLQQYYARDISAIVANFQPMPEFIKDHQAQPHIVWIANHKKQKNPEVFIDLAEKLSATLNARFSMVGRPSPTTWGASVEKRARQSTSIEFIGELSQNDLNKLLESAHLMINTSDYEGFPNTFIQSWMREVPVVSLYVDPDNVLTKNGVGILSGNVKQLYIDTHELIENSEKRILMAATARDYAGKHHSLKNAECVIALLTDKMPEKTSIDDLQSKRCP